MGHILLNNVRLYARHGVMEQERAVGAMFTLNLRLEVDFSQAETDDTLEGTVNYAEVYRAVKAEMEKPSRTLENAARRIAERIINDFPMVKQVEISLSKQNPPMGADCDSAGVQLTYAR